MNAGLQKLDQLLDSTIALGEDELADVLGSVLSGIDHAATGTYRSSSEIFWALTRVFGCYDRVAAACEEYSASGREEWTFVAATEVEHFLMRLRVLFDETAYIIRVRLPEDVRALRRPKGPGQNKQFSISQFLKFVKDHPAFCPHLTGLLENNRAEIRKFVDLRDDVAHFRAQAVIFRGDALSVGFIGSRETAQDAQRIPHTDLRAYIDSATIWMWRFLQRDVVEYFRFRVESGELGFAPFGIGPHSICMPGINRFKQILEGP